MTVKRMDHVGVVVDDLLAAIAFFTELGLGLRGQGSVGGEWVDRIIGLEGVQAEMAMMETPDGHSRIELVRFDAPAGAEGDRRAPSNAPGIRHLTFAVEGIDEVLARLRAHGAEMVGELARYKDSYRLCYIRGPEGIIIELAEELG